MQNCLQFEGPTYGPDPEAGLIAKAIGILESRLKSGPIFSVPSHVRDYLRLQAQGLKFEVFSVMFLDSQHRLIAFERMFRGTLTQTSVYPREVVVRALQLHAAAVVCHHNHPSGTAKPSRADELLTQTLKSALALVDVRVLDHFVTSDHESCSMAEIGLM